VKLFYVDLSTLQQGSAVNRQEIQAPTELPLPADQIISSVEFANNSTLIAVWMNRVQNNAYIQACQGVSCRMVSIFRSTAYNFKSTSKLFRFSRSNIYNQLLVGWSFSPPQSSIKMAAKWP
jgi:hypothetical protein